MGSGNLSPALAVGYSVTSLGALVVIGMAVAVGVDGYREYNEEDCKFGAGVSCCLLLCCLLPAFCVPLALALSGDDGSGSF